MYKCLFLGSLFYSSLVLIFSHSLFQSQSLSLSLLSLLAYSNDASCKVFNCSMKIPTGKNLRIPLASSQKKKIKYLSPKVHKETNPVNVHMSTLGSRSLLSRVLVGLLPWPTSWLNSYERSQNPEDSVKTDSWLI